MVSNGHICLIVLRQEDQKNFFIMIASFYVFFIPYGLKKFPNMKSHPFSLIIKKKGRWLSKNCCKLRKRSKDKLNVAQVLERLLDNYICALKNPQKPQSWGGGGGSKSIEAQSQEKSL